MSIHLNKISSMISSTSLQSHSGFMGAPSKQPLSPNTTANLNSKYLLLQGKLNNLQSELSREQTKLNLLQTESNLNLMKNEYMYENQPLFEDSNEDLVENKLELIQDLLVRKIELAQEIKKLETESTSIQAANINFDMEEFKKEKLPETNVDSKKVEKLIKE